MLQTVRGTQDLSHEGCFKQRFIKEKFRSICFRYGYREISTPILEFDHVFHLVGETSDIFSKETYTFLDRSGRKITLRPEGTTPIVRSLISNHLATSQQLPIKLLYEGPMFRYERPQMGRYRQFEQIGIELLGASSPTTDSEVIAMAVHILESLEIMSNVRLEINTLGDRESRDSYNKKLLDYLRAFRRDLSQTSRDKLERNPLRILDSKDQNDKRIIEGSPPYGSSLTRESKEFFSRLQEGLENLGIPFTYNPRLVRGMDYYTHTVFEFTFSHLGNESTILAGGRYDDLVKRMGGPNIPAVGWAAGVNRISLIKQLPTPKRKVVLVVPITQDLETEAIKVAQFLRKSEMLNENICIETKPAGSLRKDLAFASKTGVDYALILGKEELSQFSISVQKLPLSKQEIVPISKLDEYLRYRLSSTL